MQNIRESASIDGYMLNKEVAITIKRALSRKRSGRVPEVVTILTADLSALREEKEKQHDIFICKKRRNFWNHINKHQ